MKLLLDITRLAFLSKTKKKLIPECNCNYVKSSGKDHLHVVNVLLFILLIFPNGEGCGIALQLTQIGL